MWGIVIWSLSGWSRFLLGSSGWHGWSRAPSLKLHRLQRRTADPSASPQDDICSWNGDCPSL